MSTVKAWHSAPEEKRCRYDISGKLLTPNCEVEQKCRDHVTFGETFCMRDHYYQLFDLEKNFGEKIFCDGNSGRKDPWEFLSTALDIERFKNLKLYYSSAEKYF